MSRQLQTFRLFLHKEYEKSVLVGKSSSRRDDFHFFLPKSQITISDPHELRRADGMVIGRSVAITGPAWLFRSANVTSNVDDGFQS